MELFFKFLSWSESYANFKQNQLRSCDENTTWWWSTCWANYRGKWEWSVVQESADSCGGYHHPRYAECSVRWQKVGVSLRQLNDIAVIDLYRCPDSVYSNMLMFILYLRATETLICRRDMSLIESTSFGFSQNTIHDFQNTVLNS